MRTRVGFGIVILVLIGVTSAPAQDVGDAVQGIEIKLSDLVQNLKGGQVDWGNRMMYAAGEGIMAPATDMPNRGRAYLSAKDYARMAAIASLLMLIENTNVTSEGTGRDYMDDGVRKKIEGYVRNVLILRSERITIEDRSIVRVWVGTPIFGDQTPGTAFLEALAGTDKPKQPKLIEIPLGRALPRPSTPTKQAEAEEDARQLNALRGIAASRPVDPETSVPPTRQEGPFTSLVVDARGHNVPQAVCPKIRKLNGDQVYGGLVSKTDPAVLDGLVSYARTPETARSSDRCGTNPLMAAAIGRGGGRSMCDVVVSDETAKTIARENSAAKFLDAYKVIFVVDPPGSAVSSALAQAEPEGKAVEVASSDAADVSE